MKRDKQPWFVVKNYGYGWMPATWQGWTITLVWIAIFAGFVAWANLRFSNVWLSMTVSILFGGFWMGVLYGISMKTGEKQSWRWGKVTKAKHKAGGE